MKHLEYSPLERGVSPLELVRVAQRLQVIVEDASRHLWLRELAARKATEARAFARVGFLQAYPRFDRGDRYRP